MRIEFDDEEYPELSRYLENPKRKMKFLYFLEELFETNSFDPVVDGLKLIQRKSGFDAGSEDKKELYSFLSGITTAIEGLSKNMEGSVIGRFPVEHVVHETAAEPVKEKKKEYVEDETDYSSTEGIDFSQAIAMFDD